LALVILSALYLKRSTARQFYEERIVPTLWSSEQLLKEWQQSSKLNELLDTIAADPKKLHLIKIVLAKHPELIKDAIASKKTNNIEAIAKIAKHIGYKTSVLPDDIILETTDPELAQAFLDMSETTASQLHCRYQIESDMTKTRRSTVDALLDYEIPPVKIDYHTKGYIQGEIDRYRQDTSPKHIERIQFLVRHICDKADPPVWARIATDLDLIGLAIDSTNNELLGLATSSFPSGSLNSFERLQEDKQELIKSTGRGIFILANTISNAPEQLERALQKISIPPNQRIIGYTLLDWALTTNTTHPEDQRIAIIKTLLTYGFTTYSAPDDITDALQETLDQAGAQARLSIEDYQNLTLESQEKVAQGDDLTKLYILMDYIDYISEDQDDHDDNENLLQDWLEELALQDRHTTADIDGKKYTLYSYTVKKLGMHSDQARTLQKNGYGETAPSLISTVTQMAYAFFWSQPEAPPESEDDALEEITSSLYNL